MTLTVSNAPRPPATKYTMVQLGGENENISRDKADVNTSAYGMTFEMNQGLVQLTKVDSSSPVVHSSLGVGDYILAIDGVVTGSVGSALCLLSDAPMKMVPILYFNMRQLRLSLVEKVLGDSWSREWSDTYDECVVLPFTGNSNPLTLRFRENGSCILIDPLHDFGVMKSGQQDNALDTGNSIHSDHPLSLVVDTLNDGITCVLEAIRMGVEQQVVRYL